MFTTRLRLFRLAGIPIYMDASWLIIFALLTLSLASGLPTMLTEMFPEAQDQLAPEAYWLMGAVTALGFFACIVLHELGHALVARARGMTIRGITLFMFGGVAELGEEPVSPGTEFLMAIGGPLVSVALAILFGAAFSLGYNAEWPHPLTVILFYLATINVVVLAFNLIPAFPLDGGRVLRSIIWGITGNLRRATFWATLAGQAFAWILIAWGITNFFWGNWLGGIWMGLIGMFLSNAAKSSYQQVLVRHALRGVPVRRFMTPDPVVVPPALDLESWVEDYVYRYHHHAYPVSSNGRLEGVVTTRAASRIPRADWAHHTVGEVMAPDLRSVTISADTDALKALEKMQRQGISRLLVTQDDHLTGILSLKDLLAFLNLKLEMEGETTGLGEAER